MKLSLATLLLVTPLAAAGNAAAATGGVELRIHQTSIPSVLYVSDRFSHHNSAQPVFVTAAVAVDDEGNVTDSVAAPRTAEQLRRGLEASKEKGCEWGIFHGDRDDIPLPGTLAEAIDSSRIILVGRVIDRDYGFRFFEPGQLIEIAVEEVIQSEARFDAYYFFMPVGTFEAGPYRICKTDARYPEAPNNGERVMLLLHELDDPESRYVDPGHPERVIVLGEKGVKSASAIMGKCPLRRFSMPLGEGPSPLRSADMRRRTWRSVAAFSLALAGAQHLGAQCVVSDRSADQPAPPAYQLSPQGFTSDVQGSFDGTFVRPPREDSSSRFRHPRPQVDQSVDRGECVGEDRGA